MIKFLLVFILTVTPAFALGPMMASCPDAITVSETDCEPEYDICQNFETATTGYDNSESWNETGTVEAADTTRILRGSQSLYLSNDSTQTQSPTFTAHTDNTSTYAHFRLNINANSSASQLMFRFYDGTQSIGYLTWDYLNENIRFYNGSNGILSGDCDGCGSVSFSYDTTYHIWIRWKSETVSINDGEYQVWIGTTGTFSSATLIIDGYNGTSDWPGLDNVVFLTDNGLDFWVDQVIISNSAIGSVAN